MSDDHIPSVQDADTEELEKPQLLDSDTSAVENTGVEVDVPVETETELLSNNDEDITDEELRQRLMEELDQLVERLQALTPEYTPPPFTPHRLIELIGGNIRRFSPEMGWAVVERLRSTISEDLLDVDTWKGVWYVVNYSLEYQTDMLKRRFSGDFETDEWGFDPEFFQVVEPFFSFLYSSYWRVKTSGVENIPEEGRGLLVSNHSGQLPWDGVMIGTSIYNEHPNQRVLRNLYATWLPTVPFVSSFLARMGQVLANEDNGIRLLEQDHLVGVYPEGYKGVGKLFKDRYRLARFGRGGFVRMALKTGAPIIPVAVVGAEETYVSITKSSAIAKMIGFPFFPISLRWPWLGPLGLIPFPTKWYIDFGEPIPTLDYGPEAAKNLMLISQLTDQVRNIVQNMILDRLVERKSVFFG